MQNQESPESDQDVIDWLVEKLKEQSRSRRGVIKKLKELGLTFKAPTKKSNAAAANRNLFIREEDDMLRQLYDEHRLEDDCLDKIMQVFKKKRNKKTVINRMIQLGLVADESEILPEHERKRGGEGERRRGGYATSSDDDDEYKFSNDAGAARYSRNESTMHSKSNYEMNNRDITSYRVELEESLKEAIEWIIESLNEAAEDFEEPSDEAEDAIPIVPVTESQKLALQNSQFQCLLRSINLIEPHDAEAYWKIPANMFPDELRKRAQLLAGEIPIEESNTTDAVTTVAVNNKSDHENDDAEVDLFARLRAKRNALIYNKSDNDDDRPKPTMKERKKNAPKAGKLNSKLVKKLHPQVASDHCDAVKWLVGILEEKIANKSQKLNVIDEMFIVPSSDEHREALQDENFVKILTAINFIAPHGNESYWQIPNSFTVKELKKRAQMLAIDDEQNASSSSSSSSSDESEQMVIKRKKPKAKVKASTQRESQDDYGINTQQLKQRLAELQSSSDDENHSNQSSASSQQQQQHKKPQKPSRHVLDSSDEGDDDDDDGNDGGGVGDEMMLKDDGIMTKQANKRKSEKRERSQSPDENEMNASNNNQMKKIRRIIDSDDE